MEVIYPLVKILNRLTGQIGTFFLDRLPQWALAYRRIPSLCPGIDVGGVTPLDTVECFCGKSKLSSWGTRERFLAITEKKFANDDDERWNQPGLVSDSTSTWPPSRPCPERCKPRLGSRHSGCRRQVLPWPLSSQPMALGRHPTLRSGKNAGLPLGLYQRASRLYGLPHDQSPS